MCVCIQIVENDIFPKNICTKCESALFEAFIFKQKSAKSHRLLKKILNIDDGCQNLDAEPLTALRMSQFTQTQSYHEETETLLPDETHEDLEVQEYKIELGCTENEENEEAETIEEEEENENWPLDFESNVENRDIAIDESVDEIEDFEYVESIDDEMSSQSNGMSTKTVIDCEHCAQKIPKRQQQSHAKQHSKLFPYILNSMDFFRCNRCQMVFLLIDSLFEHLNDDNGCMELQHNNDDAYIDYQYLNNDLSIRLLSASKNFDDNTFSCGQCNLDFEDLTMFRLHIEENHSSDFDCNPEILRANSGHLCGSCNITFKTLHDAIHHIYFHQSAFECFHEECTQIFTSFAGLNSHFTSDHPDSSVECSHCSYLATNKEDLKMHQRKTCTARNLKCDFCGK